MAEKQNGSQPRLRAAVAGVLLAAGSSSRMGQNKLLLELGGETLVRRAARLMGRAGLSPLVVVVGHERDRVERELASLPHLPVENPEYETGQRSSLQAGIRRLQELPEVQAAVVVLADMPFVTTGMLEAIADRYRLSATNLVASRYGEVLAPPNLYHRSLFPELLALSGKHCARRVFRQHAEQALIVDWPAQALRDIDVAEDYQLTRSAFAAS